MPPPQWQHTAPIAPTWSLLQCHSAPLSIPASLGLSKTDSDDDGRVRLWSGRGVGSVQGESRRISACFAKAPRDSSYALLRASSIPIAIGVAPTGLFRHARKMLLIIKYGIIVLFNRFVVDNFVE